MVVVEPRATRPGRVHKLIVPRATDRPHRDVSRPGAPHHHPVVSAVHVEAHLARLRRPEGAGVVRRPPLPPGRRTRSSVTPVQPDRHRAVALTVHHGQLCFIGAVDVHGAREERIEAVRGQPQSVAAQLEGAGQAGAVARVILGRDPMDRRRDDGITQPALQRGGDRIPHRLLEVHQQPSVEHARVPGQPHHVGVTVAEADDVGLIEAREPREKAVELGERLVAVARDGPPHVPVVLLEPRPAPLVGVPVPVANVDVEQTRSEKGPRVDPVTRAVPQVLPQLLGARNVVRAREARLVVTAFLRPLLELPEHPGEVGPEGAETRVVGQNEQAWLRVEYTRGIEQRADDQRSRRMAGADLILDDLIDEGLAQLRRDRRRGILVHRAESEHAPVAALEPQRFRLPPATALERGQTAGVAGEIEHFDADRDGPQVAVVAAEQELVRPARSITGAGGHGYSRGLLSPRRGRREHDDDSELHRTAAAHGYASFSRATSRTLPSPGRARPRR